MFIKLIKGLRPLLIVITTTLAVVFFMGLCVYSFVFLGSEVTTYPCDMVNVSPDIPLSVKEQCRNKPKLLKEK